MSDDLDGAGGRVASQQRRDTDRRGGVGLDQSTIDMLSLVVREEIRLAARDGRILSDEDRDTLRAWLAKQRVQAARWERVRTTVLGAACVMALGWIGLALSKLGGLVWKAIEAKLHQP